MTTLAPAAVLWDMDGTIIDSEPYWMRAESELVASHGGEWTAADGLALVGSGLWHSAGVLRGRGVDLTERQIIDWLTERVLEQIREEIPWRPGARELIAQSHEAGIPSGLVTMSMRPMADYVANSLGFDAFSVVVSGDDVTHAKPHPEPYLNAAQALGVPIAECIAVEDSPPGLASAVASGAAVIAVQAHVVLPESPEYTLWSTLVGRNLDDLATVLSQHAAVTS